ncbi:thiolase family protein [Gammaproteobacteria bacterium]|nr:thiolase family protein [Gammaproteobacteria bacterium]MDA9049254.1 thiolase family protein [Gammaproteobacteria bacterium]MDA9340951.1 thiolase family protein [Gammaproteobacteria bacterium]MDA9371050.1 thiolase family protein [Gammaproteobacteria bacterium]MDA9973950.1 thiolase family protein [Gammaproteobacteria bacterium]|tara:strand:- start:274 stop:1467 length:1194 start_codon:yes stop_codon:yes gene_type:complete
MKTAVIVDSVRTGLAKSHRGGFNITRADDMLAHIINGMLDRNPNLDPAMVEDIIMGCGNPEGPMGHNIGRNAAVLSNLPMTTGGTTVNRYCSSGLQTISMAASQIMAGCYDTIIAGGVEQITMLSGNNNMHEFVNPKLAEDHPGIYYPMGMTAETVAKRYNVSRQAQDEIAFESQKRTAAAQEAGKFADEIIPMATKMMLMNKETGDSKEVDYVVDKDECNRPGTTMEALSGLKPVFDPENGTVTAGNSSQLSDGASVTLVMSEEKALEQGLKPLAYFRGFTTMGCEPDEMGIGPVFSVPKLLKAHNMSVDDVDLWELNEAFAVQVAYCRDQLGISMDKLNVNGGSISIGHPFGMTGSRQVGHIIRELQNQDKQFGVVTMCVGGGMGASGLFERYPS